MECIFCFCFLFFNSIEKRLKSTHPHYNNKKTVTQSNKLKKEVKIKQRFKLNCRKPSYGKKLNGIILLVDNLMFNFYALVARRGCTCIIY